MQSTQGGSFLFETPTEIFTPEQFTAEDRLMAESAERFMRQEVLLLTPRLEKQEPGLMRSLLQKAAELGLLGIDVPLRYGGLALPKTTSALLAEKIALDPSFSVSQGVHTSVASFPLLLFGTLEQQKAYLPHLATGEWIGAYALTEPEAGSDALSGRTRATLDPDSDTYYLTGNKMWITNAGFADLFIVFAQVEGRHFTAFIVERGSPGFQVEREEHKLGLKGSSTCRLSFENVPVPAKNRLGEVGQGAYVGLFTLNLGRFKIAAATVGLAKEAFRLAWEYAQERRQFGRPIGKFDLIRHKFAQMQAHIIACESAAYRLAGDLESLFGAVPDESPETQMRLRQAAAEMAPECALLKVACTEMLQFVVDEALQIYGGYGFSEEFPIARLYRDIRVNRIYEGTNEINRLNLVELLIKRFRREGPEPKDGEGSSLIGGLKTVATRSLFNLVRTEEAVPQTIVKPLADLIIALYLCESTALRARQTGLEKHQAIADLLEEQISRQLPGWLTDLRVLHADVFKTFEWPNEPLQAFYERILQG